jgi:hypothetical protein
MVEVIEEQSKRAKRIPPTVDHKLKETRFQNKQSTLEGGQMMG